MQPLTDLLKGLEVLEPFLKEQGFTFDNFENYNGSCCQITEATYTKEQKKIVISYCLSIRQVVYKFDNLTVSHDFYLDKLGFKDKKEQPDFHSNNKIIAFMNILSDFEFLAKDFFNGQCIELKEISKLQDNVIHEHNKKAWEECNFQIDNKRIETARVEFRKKTLKKV